MTLLTSEGVAHAGTRIVCGDLLALAPSTCSSSTRRMLPQARARGAVSCCSVGCGWTAGGRLVLWELSARGKVPPVG
jgi:hypothetical protein